MIKQQFGAWLLARGDDQGMVSVWQQTPTGLLWSSSAHNKHHQAVTVMAWSNDGQYLATGSADATVKVWHAHTGRLLQTYREHRAEVLALAWSSEGKHIVSCAGQEHPRLWMPHLAVCALTQPALE